MLRSRTSPTTTCRPPEHLRNVNAEGELAEDATTEDSSVVQIEGSRRIRRLVKLFDWERSAPPLGQLGASSRFSRRSLRQYGGILGLNFIREAYHATSLARMARWCARGSSTRAPCAYGDAHALSCGPCADGRADFLDKKLEALYTHERNEHRTGRGGGIPEVSA